MKQSKSAEVLAADYGDNIIRLMRMTDVERADKSWIMAQIEAFTKAFDANTPESTTAVLLVPLATMIGYLHAQVGTLQKELRTANSIIKGLQLAPFEYCGVFEPDREYRKNSIVTDGGGMWISMTNNNRGVHPGNGDPAWKLCVQRGRSGKDAR